MTKRCLAAAVPSEGLNFSIAMQSDDRGGEAPQKLRFDELPAKKKKRLRERFRSLRDQRKAQPTKSRDLIGPRPKPRYDEVFEEGVAWLDELAGPKLVEGSFTAEFSDDVWNSPTRKGDDVKFSFRKEPGGGKAGSSEDESSYTAD